MERASGPSIDLFCTVFRGVYIDSVLKHTLHSHEIPDEINQKNDVIESSDFILGSAFLVYKFLFITRPTSISRYTIHESKVVSPKKQKFTANHKHSQLIIKDIMTPELI